MTALALFARGAADQWPLHFKTGPLRNGASERKRPRRSFTHWMQQ